MININSNYIIASLGLEFSILIDSYNYGEILNQCLPPFEVRDITNQMDDKFSREDIKNAVSLVKRLDGYQVLDASYSLEGILNSTSELMSMYTRDELDFVDDFVQELLRLDAIAIGTDFQIYQCNKENQNWFDNYAWS